MISTTVETAASLAVRAALITSALKTGVGRAEEADLVVFGVWTSLALKAQHGMTS